MGQKVNPIGFRVCNGNKRTWASNWCVKTRKEYVQNVADDLKVQNFFRKIPEFCKKKLPKSEKMIYSKAVSGM